MASSVDIVPQNGVDGEALLLCSSICQKLEKLGDRPGRKGVIAVTREVWLIPRNEPQIDQPGVHLGNRDFWNYRDTQEAI
jgi:hypothetical protein